MKRSLGHYSTGHETNYKQAGREKNYFKNNDIDYYQLDLNIPQELSKKFESNVIRANIIGLNLTKPEYQNYFNVVISFGVLGYIEFSLDQIHNYLNTIKNLLAFDGIFYLKLDIEWMKKTFKKYKFG